MLSPSIVTTQTAIPRARRLEQFVEWVRANIRGDEKGEAQLFLDRLLQAFEQPGLLEVGGQAEYRVKRAKDSGGGTGFADYVWKPVVLVEMKRRGVRLGAHHRQLFDYWVRLVPGRPAFAVLCNFDEFWIYDFNRQMDVPVETLRLEALPARAEALAFLYPGNEQPRFADDHVAVTQKAAGHLADVYTHLTRPGRNVDPGLARRFTMQSLMALFSEDIGLLPLDIVRRLLDECRNPAQTYDLLGDLFQWMNTPGVVAGGKYKGVRHFNGGVYTEPARIELLEDEIALLREAANANWSKVRPEIFGSLFEHSLDRTERKTLGAFFTSPVDIMKIVGPTIVEPWRDLIENATTLRRLDDLLQGMLSYRVLDPACGSGNFLYVAYRELKRLEARIHERRAKLAPTSARQQGFRFVGLRQFFGMDINPFAIDLAMATLAIAHQLVIEELGLLEDALPLDNLRDNFVPGDALVGLDGTRTPWPPADAIIGNPPFLGAKRLKPELGDDYVHRLRRAYKDIPGMADYCVYWFRRAHDALPRFSDENPVRGRAGLVGTQNVRNNRSRVGGLDYIAESGTIIDGVPNQPWSGDAKVHVSIVNWVKGSTSAPRRLWKTIPRDEKSAGTPSGAPLYELEARLVARINSSLSDDTDVSTKKPLSCNRSPKRCFQGKIPGYDGFLLSPSQASQLSSNSADVVVPYLTGRELLDEFQIDRWAIDFGNRDLVAASAFSSAFEHCRRLVLPAVRLSWESAVAEKSDMAPARKEHLDRWWQFWNRRDEMSRVLAAMPRYIGCSRVTRRPIMVFLASHICPSDLVQVFAFDDDYSFGVLQSALHFEWFSKSSRLKVESDMRYSVREVFETFPWPQGRDGAGPSETQVRSVAAAARMVRQIRVENLAAMAGGGLRALYRLLELPGRTPLKEAHATLDDAVREAFGFAADADPLSSLLALNQEVAQRCEAGLCVVPPGLPPSVASGQWARTDDCYTGVTS